MLHVNNSLESETITSVFDIIITINFMHHHRISNSKQIQSMIAILIPRIYFSIKGFCSTFNFSATSTWVYWPASCCNVHCTAICTSHLKRTMRSTCIKEAVSLKVQFAIDRDKNEGLDFGIWAEIFYQVKHKEICTFSKPEGVEVSFILKKKRKFWRYLYLFFKNDANLFIRFTIE